MKVQFSYTQEEIVDASMRFLARSKTIRSARWQALLWTAGLTWGLIFALFGASLKAGLIGLLAASISALIYPGMHRRSVQKRLRKLCKEKFGDTPSFICEVELTPAGIWTQSQNTQTTSEWKNVEEISVTEDSVDIFTRQGGGGVVVRNRAFKSADERRGFIEMAQQFAAQAREVHSSAK
jgi:hypothetical protein